MGESELDTRDEWEAPYNFMRHVPGCVLRGEANAVSVGQEGLDIVVKRANPGGLLLGTYQTHALKCSFSCT